MTVPLQYSNSYMPVKYFLSSYRALSDGRSGIRQLEELLSTSKFLVSEWKVIWIGTCAILRTSIEMFRADARSCLSARIRDEIAAEWDAIGDHEEKHPIFWQFLRQERNNIMHEYEWRAYEAWMKPDGTFRAPRLSLITMSEGDDGARPVLLMKGGPFKDRNSLDLLKEGANWVEDRIFNAIRRAGFDPEEYRGLVDFQPRPKLEGGGLLTFLAGEPPDRDL